MVGIKMLLKFLSNAAVQVRAAMEVGLSSDDASKGERQFDEREPAIALYGEERHKFSKGRMTRNGRGSLEVGAGKTRVNE